MDNHNHHNIHIPDEHILQRVNADDAIRAHNRGGMLLLYHLPIDRKLEIKVFAVLKTKHGICASAPLRETFSCRILMSNWYYS